MKSSKKKRRRGGGLPFSPDVRRGRRVEVAAVDRLN
jgi:hypothetical protein